MLRVFKDFFDSPLFNLLTAEHDHNAVSHLSNNRHVVGDEHNGGAGFTLQSVHQGQDLSLNGHIQSRCWLIRN